MYLLNNDEKKVVADFFAEQYAGACVVKNTNGVVRKTLPYTLEKTSALAGKLRNGLEGIPMKLTAFVRNVNDSMAREFGQVYTTWHSNNRLPAGTFYLSGADSDPAVDCAIQVGLLAGDVESAAPLDIQELGEWIVEQIVYVIESNQFNEDVEALFNAIRRELSTI